MSAPSQARNKQWMKIPPEKRLATDSERTITFKEATN